MLSAGRPSYTDRRGGLHAPMSAIVRRIDHVLIKTDDVRSAFALLSQTLALPVAWPLFPYQGFLSGAVSAGNLNLEVLQPLDQGLPPHATVPGTRLIGIAFEPHDVAGAAAELDRRAIGHRPPWSFELNDPTGRAIASWTSIDLDGWPECPILLLVKYDRDQDARRAALRAQLEERRGGPLGVRACRVVALAVDDTAVAARRWQALFEPLTPAAPASWLLDGGASVRLVPAGTAPSRSIGLEVERLETAVGFLRGQGLLGAVADREAAVTLGDAPLLWLRERVG
jgi:hypothetical protein